MEEDDEDESIWYVCNFCKEKKTFKHKLELKTHKKTFHLQQLREIIKKKRNASSSNSTQEAQVNDDEPHQIKSTPTPVPSTRDIVQNLTSCPILMSKVLRKDREKKVVQENCSQYDEVTSSSSFPTVSMDTTENVSHTLSTPPPQQQNSNSQFTQSNSSINSIFMNTVQEISTHNDIQVSEFCPDQEEETLQLVYDKTTPEVEESEIDEIYEEYLYCNNCFQQFVSEENHQAHIQLCKNFTNIMTNIPETETTLPIKSDIKDCAVPPDVIEISDDEKSNDNFDPVLLNIVPCEVSEMSANIVKYLILKEPQTTKEEYIPVPKIKNRDKTQQDKDMVQQQQQQQFKNPEQTEYPKPPLSCTALASLALKNTKTRTLTMSSIYQFISYYFPYYRDNTTQVKNCLNSTLLSRHTFKKLGKVYYTSSSGVPRKGGVNLWGFNPEKLAYMEQQLVSSVQSLSEIHKSMQQPELFLLMIAGNLSPSWDTQIEQGRIEYDQNPEISRIVNVNGVNFHSVSMNQQKLSTRPITQDKSGSTLTMNLVPSPILKTYAAKPNPDPPLPPPPPTTTEDDRGPRVVNFHLIPTDTSLGDTVLTGTITYF